MRDVRGLALVWAAACALAADSPQTAAIARQKEAIEQQRAALEAQGGPLAAQRASVDKQKTSAEKQPRLANAAATPTMATPVGPSLAWAPPATGCDTLSDGKLADTIQRAASVNALAPELVRAVIQRESAFQPCAISSAGAMGMMQLMPTTAQGLNVADPFNPEENIFAGSRYLRQLMDRFGGDLSLALGAYNAGPARVEASGGIPPIAETRAYVQEILGRLR